jgi:hypothetical protein
MQFGKLFLVAIVCSLAANAADSDCLSCHPAETRVQSGSRMAHAMLPATASAFGQNLPPQALHESDGGYSVAYQASPFGSIVATSQRGTDRAEGVINWIMGAGAQGQTPLVETDGAVLESHVSYFPGIQRFGITVGQSGGASANAQMALGEKQSHEALRACVSCHATGITANLQPVMPGIHCERCHSGAARHAAGKGQVINPGKMNAAEQIKFCGACHRDSAPVDDNQLENIRFQPLRLKKSECFIAGKIECTTCHSAHQDARRNDPAFYNAKCTACHSTQDSPRMHVDSRRKEDCIGCHMPYVELHPALHFTDHFIRVVKKGDLPEEALRRR